MKFCLAFFFALIGLVTSRPQDYEDSLLCSEIDGYRCVPEENCLSSEGFLEDQIFSDFSAKTDGADKLQIRGQERAEDAICEPSNIGKGKISTTIRGAGDGLICCQEKNIQNEKAEDCSVYARDGYSCVPASDCSGVLSDPDSGPRKEVVSPVVIRSGGFGKEDAENAVCTSKKSEVAQKQFTPKTDGAGLLGPRSAEGDQVCCHQRDINEGDYVDGFEDDSIKFCAEYADQGYSCVPEDECQGELDPRSNIFEEELACAKPSETCCQKEKLIETDGRDVDPEPEFDLCSNYEKDGYECVKENRCSPPISSLNVRGADDDAKNALCRDSPAPGKGEPDIGALFVRDGQSEVCCYSDHILQEIPKVTQKCSIYARDRFQCVDELQCLDSTLFNSDGGLTVDIRDDLNENDYAPHLATCDVANQVCCLNILQEPIIEERCSDSSGYKCLPVTKCNLEEPVAQKTAPRGVTVLDIRSGGFLDVDHLYSLCEGDDEICCEPEKQIKEKEKPIVVLKKKKDQPQCGRHNVNGLGVRVLGPQDDEYATHFGEWPHVCILMKINSVGKDEFIGGASLISPGIVITAAHKVNGLDPKIIKVRCGDWNVKKTEDEYKKHQDRRVETISIHPRYSGIEKVHNDAALLHVKRDFELDSHLDTICLPQYPDDRNRNYDQTKFDCSVQGFGKSAFGPEGRFQEFMRQINLPIVKNSECQQKLRKTRLPDNFNLHDSFLCAGGAEEGGQDACEGDGGGPLVCRQGDRYVLAGIVAWGIGCGKPDVPGVYAAVSDVICWIDWVTKCKHGNEYASFYDYPQCANWIDKEISSLEGNSEDKKYLSRVKIMKKTCENEGKIQPKKVLVRSGTLRS